MRGVRVRDHDGGAYHAIIGTLEQVGIASLIAIPVGLLAAVYVVEHGRGPLVPAVRFVTDVMTGVPSIVAGLFVFTFWVLALGQGFSGLAAALALAILMRTLGRRVIKMDPMAGFAAQTVASSVLFATAHAGLPVSTTHVITSSVMGVGATRKLSAVRWGVAGNIATAWVLTIPAAATVGALFYLLSHAVLSL